MTIVLFLAFSCTPVTAQTVSKHSFNFKGFSIIINDDAFDENNNHLLVGEIKAIETEESKRDANINKIFDLKGYCNDVGMGIIITTNKDYKTLQIARSFIGKKAVYNRNKKQFTIGANFFDYLKVDNESFSAWQPIIIQIDLKLKGTTYWVQKPYSCILTNMVVENNEIIIFTRSRFDRSGFNEKAEVIRVTTSKYHMDNEKSWIQVLEPLSSQETTYNDVGRITLSDVSKVDNAYYFTTSNLNQFSLKNINHLYQLKDNKLEEILYFSDYLEWKTEGSSDWININEFVVNSTKNYLFLTHKGATKKEMLFSKTDASFNKLLSQNIPLNDYADFNKMLLLENGDIIILMVNDKATWSYFLYNSDMQLIKEIISTIPKEYYPNKLKKIENDKIGCIFYIDNTNKKDCVLQTINLN